MAWIDPAIDTAPTVRDGIVRKESRQMFHDLKEDGYSVEELHRHLSEAIAAGEGKRKLMIGPTGAGEDGNEGLACPVIGIEANSDTDGPEKDIYWLYPDVNEWWSPADATQ